MIDEEIDRIISRIEDELGRIRALRARQIMQLAAAGMSTTLTLTHACRLGPQHQDDPPSAA